MVEALYISNGIPWDVVSEMDWQTRLACVIILGQKEGNEFDWDAGTWKQKD